MCLISAGPYSSIVEKFRDLDWKVLMHPTYSRYIAPSVYHLYQSMTNDLTDEELAPREACGKRFCKFLPIRVSMGEMHHDIIFKMVK